MNKVFCPHCGNQTLKKVAVTLNEDGSIKMHFSKNPKVLNSRGLRVRHTHTHRFSFKSEAFCVIQITTTNRVLVFNLGTFAGGRGVFQHSLPLPHGGKHSSNPHLVEDQRFPQQRLSHKARQKTDVFSPDYVAGASPFCENDIYSRAANLQIRDGRCGGGRRRANPNAARKKFVKK